MTPDEAIAYVDRLLAIVAIQDQTIKEQSEVIARQKTLIEDYSELTRYRETGRSPVTDEQMETAWQTVLNEKSELEHLRIENVRLQERLAALERGEG